MEFTVTSILQSVNNDIIGSNGNYVHPTNEGRTNFQKWFKQSKVKDVQGRPQIMFHGTFNCFDSFDKIKLELVFLVIVKDFLPLVVQG